MCSFYLAAPFTDGFVCVDRYLRRQRVLITLSRDDYGHDGSDVPMSADHQALSVPRGDHHTNVSLVLIFKSTLHCILSCIGRVLPLFKETVLSVLYRIFFV